MVNGTGACYRFMTSELSDLLQYFETKSRILVITGAGISAESGIPTYRNDKGEWQRSRPIQYQEFVREEACRQRYWTRSAVGWQAVQAAISRRVYGTYRLRKSQSPGVHCKFIQNYSST